MSNERQEYQRRLRNEMEDWSTKGEMIGKRLDERERPSNPQEQQFDDFHEQFQQLRAQVQQLEDATDAEWQTQRQQVEQALNQFRRAYNATLEKSTQRSSPR